MAKKNNSLDDSDMDVLVNLNPNYKGFGEPSPTTKRLVAEGLVDLVFHEDGLWSGALTKKAEKLIKK